MNHSVDTDAYTWTFNEKANTISIQDKASGRMLLKPVDVLLDEFIDSQGFLAPAIAREADIELERFYCIMQDIKRLTPEEFSRIVKPLSDYDIEFMIITHGFMPDVGDDITVYWKGERLT